MFILIQGRWSSTWAYWFHILYWCQRLTILNPLNFQYLIVITCCKWRRSGNLLLDHHIYFKLLENQCDTEPNLPTCAVPNATKPTVCVWIIATLLRVYRINIGIKNCIERNGVTVGQWIHVSESHQTFFPSPVPFRIGCALRRSHVNVTGRCCKSPMTSACLHWLTMAGMRLTHKMGLA